MKKRWIFILLAVVIVLCGAFALVKGLYERDHTIVLEQIPLQSETNPDAPAPALYLRLTVKKHLFSDRLDITGTASITGELQVPESVSGFDALIAGQLAQGVTVSASPGNGFLYGRTNPYRILLSSSGFSLPADDPVGPLHLTLSVEVVPSGYHLVENQSLADRVDLSITPADTETASACRYVCDLTELRLALGAICQ